jgi:hypothetical protein
MVPVLISGRERFWSRRPWNRSATIRICAGRVEIEIV